MFDGCNGNATSSGTVDNLERFCCYTQSQGLARGYSYQHFSNNKCFPCPKGNFN